MRVSRRAFQVEGTESVNDDEREDSTSKNWVMLGRNWCGGVRKLERVVGEAKWILSG